MKVWITIYALTDGIIEQDVVETNTPDIVLLHTHQYVHGEGVNWHRTRLAALRKAESMRVAKLASLRKSIARLEALRFD